MASELKTDSNRILYELSIKKLASDYTKNLLNHCLGKINKQNIEIFQNYTFRVNSQASIRPVSEINLSLPFIREKLTFKAELSMTFSIFKSNIQFNQFIKNRPISFSIQLNEILAEEFIDNAKKIGSNLSFKNMGKITNKFKNYYIINKNNRDSTQLKTDTNNLSEINHLNHTSLKKYIFDNNNSLVLNPIFKKNLELKSISPKKTIEKDYNITSQTEHNSFIKRESVDILDMRSSHEVKKSDELIDKLGPKFLRLFELLEKNEFSQEKVDEILKKELILIKAILISKKSIRDKILSRLSQGKKERYKILYKLFKEILQESINGMNLKLAMKLKSPDVNSLYNNDIIMSPISKVNKSDDIQAKSRSTNASGSKSKINKRLKLPLIK